MFKIIMDILTYFLNNMVLLLPQLVILALVLAIFVMLYLIVKQLKKKNTIFVWVVSVITVITKGVINVGYF